MVVMMVLMMVMVGWEGDGGVGVGGAKNVRCSRADHAEIVTFGKTTLSIPTSRRHLDVDMAARA